MKISETSFKLTDHTLFDERTCKELYEQSMTQIDWEQWWCFARHSSDSLTEKTVRALYADFVEISFS